MKSTLSKSSKLPRNKKATISFNDLEHQALEKYCKKYKVRNKTKFMRETIMRAVISKFSDDYPTLWDQNQ
jgi:hypothetical protein